MPQVPFRHMNEADEIGNYLLRFKMAAVANDAATMLAEALQKMDGLISDDQLIMESLKTQPHACSPKEKVVSLLEELKGLLEEIKDDAVECTIEISGSTIAFLTDWLHSPKVTSNRDLQKTEQQTMTSAEKHLLQISRLQDEKESLILQVSVLTDQVEAQGEKIRDLEFTKEELQIKLEEAEQFLESEIIKTTNLLNEKLQLVTEISSLKKAPHSTPQTESIGCKEDQEALLAEKEMEIEMLKDHIEVLLDEQEIASRSHHSEGQPASALKSQLREKASEVNHLKMEVETLTVACKEKDKKFQELQQTLVKFKRIEEMLMKANESKELDSSPVVSLDGIDSSSIQSADMVTTTSSTSSPEPYVTTPRQSRALFTESYTQAVNNPVTPSLRALKTETPPASPANRKRHGIRASFGKGLMKLRGPKSSSEPNLAATECEGNKYSQVKETSREQGNINYQNHDEEKKTSFSKFGKAITKLRRTKSLGMNPADRLAVVEPVDLKSYTGFSHSDYGDQLELPFSQWSRQMVLSWLDDLGLGHYSVQCGRVITCGQDLLKASPAQLEKDMGLKNPLHRKKLQLALQALVSDGADVMGRLSNHWVLGWLDDIGLPQYKDSFSEGSVDGHMLNYLTYSDLLHLKVHNTLHHITLKRAIQCLRLHNFHPNCLKRHPVDESWFKGADVLLWTNSRVTEWLRLVDLAEYAPNLRGSGVHGSLMILEPRFTAESLAALLSIPSSKTLLRRHLATHFQSLVGTACHKVKEEAAGDPLFQPLMPGIKHKIVRRTSSFSALRKRGKGDVELDDYVCPMDLEVPPALTTFVVQRSRRSAERNDESGLQSRIKRDEDREIQGDDHVTGTIGAFSQELDSLTHMLKEERHNTDDGAYEV